MPQKKTITKTFKNLILLIAKNDGIELSEITKNKRLRYQNVEFINEMGLLDFGGENAKNNPSGLLRFKKDIATFQIIAKILENQELVKLMKTKYYRDNLKNYHRDLAKSFGEINCSSLPDHDYLDYALRNSPSTVRFFLTENYNTGSLKSIYDSYIMSRQENPDKSKIEKIDDLNLFWENLIFEKIQEDLQNKILLNPNNYYTGYLPIAKKTLEKLIKWGYCENKDEKKSFLNVIKRFF
jgi:hypothetical protein